MTHPNTDAPADNPLSAAPVPAEARPQTTSAGAPGFVECSSQIDAISAALAKAQGQIANPTKDSINPHFKAQYADLSSGLNAIRSALSANALAIVQTTRMDGEMLMLHTMLAHGSGQWIGSQWPVIKLPAPPQGIGSALTYARRYTLFALVGIAGEEDDDDGNAASGREGIEADDIAFVEQLLRDTDSDVPKFLSTIGAPSVAKLNVAQFKRATALLSEKKRRMSAL